MSTPTFVNHGGRLAGGFSPTIEPNMPASLVTGNLLIAVVGAGIAGGDRTFTFPAGWTKLPELDYNDPTGSDQNMAVAYHIVDGTEGSVLVIGIAGGNTDVDALVLQYTGNTTIDPVPQYKKGAALLATNITSQGLTMERNNSLAVHCLTGNSDYTTPSPFVEDFNPGFRHIVVAHGDGTADTEGDVSADCVFVAANGFDHGWFTLEIASEPPTAYTPASMGLGVSMSAIVNPTLEVAAAMNVGVSEAAVVSAELNSSVAPALGLAMSAGLITIFSFNAAPAVGAALSAVVIASDNPPPPVIIIAT